MDTNQPGQESISQPERQHMPETRYHVYYRVAAPDEVRVVAIYSAVRGRGPRL